MCRSVTCRKTPQFADSDVRILDRSGPDRNPRHPTDLRLPQRSEIKRLSTAITYSLTLQARTGRKLRNAMACDFLQPAPCLCRQIRRLSSFDSEALVRIQFVGASRVRVHLPPTEHQHCYPLWFFCSYLCSYVSWSSSPCVHFGLKLCTTSMTKTLPSSIQMQGRTQAYTHRVSGSRTLL
jgi:hypothetical protein